MSPIRKKLSGLPGATEVGSIGLRLESWFPIPNSWSLPSSFTLCCLTGHFPGRPWKHWGPLSHSGYNLILMKCALHIHFQNKRASFCLTMVHLCSKLKTWHPYEVIKNAPKEKTHFCFQNKSSICNKQSQDKLNYKTLNSVWGMHTELSYQSSWEMGTDSSTEQAQLYRHSSLDSERDWGTTPLVSCS